MSKLYVIRHGETDFNVQGRYTGSTDVPLNQKGISQAKRIAEKLVDYQIDIIISSSLTRAVQTADYIKEMINKPVIVMADFRERCSGIYEGLTKNEAMRRYPDAWAKQSTRQLDGAPTGGETIRECRNRIVKGLEKVKISYADKNILLVCHGFVSREINRFYKNLSDEETFSFNLGNCEIAEYELINEVVL